MDSILSIEQANRAVDAGAKFIVSPGLNPEVVKYCVLYEKKNGWIDFNAGSVAEGESLDDAGDRLLDYVLRVASGEQTKAEAHGCREISIFKDGVVL